ncbi:MAG TPA: peptidoglycan DD-metalloendopeptidase family protein [Thermomicrobiaceae bacterium]|nr:peptidoglycan DD-metalloendopeptidase family protein [Thermomicrobiaceae bacterium]
MARPQRGLRLPVWLMALAAGASVAGALALPLQRWQTPPPAAAHAPAAVFTAWAPAGPGSTLGYTLSSAPAASGQEIENTRQALAQLTDTFQRVQKENAALRDAVQAQAEQLADARTSQQVADQQRQDEVAAAGSQMQAQVSQWQGQVASAAQVTQDRLAQLDSSVHTIEQLDAALRAKLGMPAISYATTAIPDLKTVADPQGAAQAALSSLQARIDAVTADLNTVSAKADEQARAQLLARTATTGQFVWPTQGTITQPFGPTSLTLEPAYEGYAHFHQGMDIADSMNTPILAADGGTVVFAGWTDAGYGNCVQIDHGNGLITLYGHMAQTPMVHVGQRVAKGQQIGLMGTTGNSTGPHLHFAVLKNGVWVNPANYLP